jgi:hypothetical protein
MNERNKAKKRKGNEVYEEIFKHTEGIVFGECIVDMTIHTGYW